MGGAAQATLCRTAVHTTNELKPKGLGGKGLGTGLTQGPHAYLAGPKLRRQWTTAKQPRDTSAQCLPFLLDISLSLFDTLDLMKSSVDSEVVFQATLQVPAHHALACRMQAYGTPFAAPDLQAAAGELGDADLEFAACIAAPPDLDEQMSMNIGRVMSMLEQNRAELQARAAPAAAQNVRASGSGAAAQQQAVPAAQQLRAGTTTQVQQQAPKVLVSVDDAEAGTAQMQRTNSTKKQPKFMSVAQGYGKRAMQALLGFGYLLTVLHEKHLGGHIEFSAAALTAATSTTPSMANGHVRQQQRSASGKGGKFGMLAGLRQMVQECPSLGPMASTSFRLHRSFSGQAGGSGSAAGSAAGPAASSAAAAAGSVGSVGSVGVAAGSAGGGAAEGSAVAAAAAGIEAAELVRTPVRMEPSGPGMEPASSFDMVWESINSPTPNAAGPVHGLALQLSLSAPLKSTPSSNLVRALEEEGAFVFGGCSSSSEEQHESTEAAELSKVQDMGREGSMDRLLDEALQQLAATEPAAASAMGLPGPVAGRAGADTAPREANFSNAPSNTSRSSFSRMTPFQKIQVRSHFLPDQGVLTSPLPASGFNKPLAAWLLPPLSPNGLPRSPLAPQQQQQQQVQTPPNGTSASSGGAGLLLTPEEGSSPPSAAAAGLNTTPVPSPRILRPMMSMRLTCQPKWQYNEALDVPSKAPQQQQKQSQQQQQQKRQAVNVHEDENVMPASGLWPTMSFSLVPVRIQPSSAHQPQPAYAAGRA